MSLHNYNIIFHIQSALSYFIRIYYYYIIPTHTYINNGINVIFYIRHYLKINYSPFYTLYSILFIRTLMIRLINVYLLNIYLYILFPKNAITHNCLLMYILDLKCF